MPGADRCRAFSCPTHIATGFMPMTREEVRVAAAFECVAMDLAELNRLVTLANETVAQFIAAFEGCKNGSPHQPQVRIDHAQT